MTRQLGTLALGAALLLGIGCEKPGATEQQKENQAGQDNATAQQQSARESASAEAERERTIAVARADLDRQRSDFRNDKQKDLDDLDVKIANLEAKAKTATGADKARLDQYLPTIRQQRTVLGNDLRSIDTAMGSTFDAVKEHINHEYDTLKSAIDKAS
ncbi:MAG TPA: hypothetical protein VKU41_08670 [Polyangiaceae bacterium]|nr:hypothetical protein [Polyangiaceae bacterium]